jgi:hypothetical protein
MSGGPDFPAHDSPQILDAPAASLDPANDHRGCASSGLRPEPFGVR